MDSEEEKAKKKKKDSKKGVIIPDGTTFQVLGSSPQEKGVDSANDVMKKFLKKSED